MKKSLLCGLLLISTPSMAQEHILGIRGGLVKNFNGNNPSGNAMFNTLEKGLYYRYNTKGRLSLDIGLAYHKHSELTGPQIIYDAGFSIYSSKITVDNIDFQYSLQYNITPKKLREIAILKNINSYIGIVLAHRSGLDTKTWYTEDNYTGFKGEQKYTAMDIHGMAGLNYTISYSLNFIIIQSTSTIMAGTGDFGQTFARDSDFPSSRLSINLGIGYKLNNN